MSIKIPKFFLVLYKYLSAFFLIKFSVFSSNGSTNIIRKWRLLLVLNLTK